MVTQTSIYGHLYPAKLLGNVLFQQRPHAYVDDVAGDEHKVGAFGVYQVHPTRELRPAIVISQVQVANHHHFKRFVQMLRSV